MQSDLERIEVVAVALERAGVEVAVFVGGAIVGSLLTDSTAPPPRVTIDVDVVVDVETAASYTRLQAHLIAQGFVPAPGGPVCRWLVHGVVADIMPLEEKILGFGNRWYRRLIETGEPHELASGKKIRLASAPYLVATKLEAYRNRGSGDLLMSTDITDIVSLVDGREELAGELDGADEQVKDFVRGQLRELIEVHHFLETVPAHLPADGFSATRVPALRKRLKLLAGLNADT